MELLIPDPGNCTQVSFDIEFRCTALKFRRLKHSVGIDTDADSVVLIDLFPDKNALIKVGRHLRRNSKSKSSLCLGVELRYLRKLPDERISDGKQIDSNVVWDGLVAIIPETTLVNTDVSFHYPRGTYRLKDMLLRTSAANIPRGKPMVMVDGVSLRFSNFPNGLEQMRIYTMGPLSREKCLQIDVYHTFQASLTEDIFEKAISISRIAAGLFVEEKGDSNGSATDQRAV